MRSFKLRVMAQVLPFLLIAPGMIAVQAQAQKPPPSRGEAMAAMNAGPHQPSGQYTRQQIDQLIAPVALYPDQLLAQVLMAATYPQQLIEAADWLQDPQHAVLQGDDLAGALEPLPWDPSVKALTAFPAVVAMMTEHLEWTEALGLAFATQQAQMMQRVQALRQLAVKSGRIRNVKHVSVERDANVIRIVSAEPDRVFVPVYNPTVVYGAWPDRDYPPIYVMPPRYFAPGARETVVETIEPGFQVYSYPVVASLWGWTRPDWRSSQITIRTEEYRRISRDVRPIPDNRWRHEGPVVIVNPPAARTANRAAVQAPAGTVAPAQAAAVAALPQQAARHGDRVRVEQSAAPAGSETPASNAAASRQPSQSQGQPQASEAGQTRDQAGKTQIEANQPGKTQAEKAQADKAQADKAQAEKAQAAKAEAEKAQAEKAQADQARAAKAQADKVWTEKTQADKAQADTAQANEAQATKTRAEKAQADRAARAQADSTATGKERRNKAPTTATEANKAAAERAQAGKAQAARAQAEKAQAEKARRDNSRAEQTRRQGDQAARPESRAAARPNQTPPPPVPSQSAARPAPTGETRGEGSSIPPSAGAAPRGHEPAAGHKPARSPADRGQPDTQER